MPHRAISWFLWPTYYADSAFGPGGPIPIIAICNPLTWLATVPAVAWLALRAHRERRMAQALLPALVLAGWLPFAVASRPIWLHSALAVLPFALVAVASAASTLAGDTRRSSRRLLAYAAAVALVALPLCLLATGLAMDIPGLREVALAYRPPGSFEP